MINISPKWTKNDFPYPILFFSSVREANKETDSLETGSFVVWLCYHIEKKFLKEVGDKSITFGYPNSFILVMMMCKYFFKFYDLRNK